MKLLTLSMAVAVCCILPVWAQQKRPDGGAQLNSVALSTGVTMEYAERGHGKGKVVIFLHGYLDSYFSFSQVMDLLPPQYHAYALTQRGHGDTDKPLSGYSMTDFSEDVIAFMDHFGIHKAHVVGHSMGSVIAQRVAIDHPDRVNKLVLIGSGADMTQNEVLLAFRDLAITLVDPIGYDLVYELQASVTFNPVPADFLDMIVTESLKVPARVWVDALDGLLAADHVDELASITAPTLIIWGDKDDIFLAADQQALDTGIPNSTLLIYTDVGHGMQWEQPERVTLDLAAFLH
jgi:pimeloyl-ACP methyl ester carboxylesterase